MSDAPMTNELIRALKDLDRAYVRLIEAGRDRIVSLGGQCDPVDVMERGDPYLRQAREAVSKAESTVEPPPKPRTQCSKCHAMVPDGEDHLCMSGRAPALKSTAEWWTCQKCGSSYPSWGYCQKCHPSAERTSGE